MTSGIFRGNKLSRFWPKFAKVSSLKVIHANKIPKNSLTSPDLIPYLEEKKNVDYTSWSSKILVSDTAP